MEVFVNRVLHYALPFQQGKILKNLEKYELKKKNKYVKNEDGDWNKEK